MDSKWLWHLCNTFIQLLTLKILYLFIFTIFYYSRFSLYDNIYIIWYFPLEIGCYGSYERKMWLGKPVVHGAVTKSKTRTKSEYFVMIIKKYYFCICYSGLDSYSSFQIMTYLQTLAREGRTIIVVIHQPSSRLLELIDDILLLSQGKCLYNGPLDQLLLTFSSVGLQCPQYYNRADFGMSVFANNVFIVYK